MISLQTITLTAQIEHQGDRIDRFLSLSIEDVTRTAAARLIDDGAVTVNGKSIAKNYKLSAGDVVLVHIPQPRSLEILAQDIPLDIAYEDDDLLVVNKPKGMVVHPAPGHAEGTLVNALMAHCKTGLSGINGVMRPGIVHRIDKDTSGLLIVAKNDFAHHALAEQIRDHSFTRQYEAVVYGNIKLESGTIQTRIGRHPADRKRMAVLQSGGREAVTHYSPVAWYQGFTQVQIRLETGRTHQIRVHMASIGHSVAGDPVYGVRNVITKLHGQCLHARVIGFHHPRDGRYIELTSRLPAYFTDFIGSLIPMD